MDGAQHADRDHGRMPLTPAGNHLEQAMNSQEKIVPDNLDWKMKLDFTPVPMPA